MRGDEIMGRSGDGRTVVLRRRLVRHVPGLDIDQPVYGYVAVPAGRDADPDDGVTLGFTGGPGLRAALAGVLGADGAAAVLAIEADALLGRRR